MVWLEGANFTLTRTMLLLSRLNHFCATTHRRTRLHLHDIYMPQQGRHTMVPSIVFWVLLLRVCLLHLSSLCTYPNPPRCCQSSYHGLHPTCTSPMQPLHMYRPRWMNQFLIRPRRLPVPSCNSYLRRTSSRKDV